MMAMRGVAQNSDSSSVSLTVQQAVEYAMKNQTKIQNAELDEQIARNKAKEILGLGFPQLNGSLDVKDFLEIPTSLIPGQFFGGPPGSYIPVKFGTKYNASVGVDASQLIFSSDYFVGVQSMKVYADLMQKATARSRTETSAAVQKAYYTVLVNAEHQMLLDTLLARFEKLKNDTRIVYENGFVEKIDADRSELAYNNLKVMQESVSRYKALSEALLKYQLGMDYAVSLVLTDKLETVKLDTVMPLVDNFDYTQRVEFSLLQAQKRMSELQLKRDRLSYLPTLAAYGSLSTQAQRSEFDFTDTKKGWFPISLIGVRMGVPIFDGLQKHRRIQQSKLSLTKSENDMRFLKSSLELDHTSARIALVNGISTLKLRKQSQDLAMEVYNTARAKYEQGVGSSIELLQAESALNEAQNNYFNALQELLMAKVEFDRASGKLAK